MIAEQLHLDQSTIWLGSDCIAEVFEKQAIRDFSSYFVVSQSLIWNYHGERLEQGLRTLGKTVSVKHVPDGETHKNLEQFGQLCDWLATKGADRRSLLIVLGGGVVGDMAGFVAATYMRGIAWMYIPTTLLAQQDASVGGKVAVNIPQGKNLIGQFWSPRWVVMDSAVLSTLPTRQIHAGYMELLKHGVLEGDQLLEEVSRIPLEVFDWKPYLPTLSKGLKVKLNIVQEDPYEKDRRRLLNLGHTLGHAIESYLSYRGILHGEAVGIGLVFVCLVAQSYGSTYQWAGLRRAVRERLPRLDVAFWEPDKILDLTAYDKKSVGGKVAWIIPDRPGKVLIKEGIDRPILELAMQRLIAWLR